MIRGGTYWSPLRSFRKKGFAACVLRRLCDPHIQHVAVLIHCSPQIVPLAIDGEKDLVQMPLVAATRATTAQFIGVRLPKRAGTTAVRLHRSRRSRAGRRPFLNRTEN